MSYDNSFFSFKSISSILFLVLLANVGVGVGASIVAGTAEAGAGLGAFSFAPRAHAAAAVDPDEIVAEADRGRALDGDNTFRVKVEDFNGKKKIRSTTYDVAMKGVTNSLVETIFPDRQKGRKLLMKDDDLWFFTPDLQRPTRVSMQQRLTGEVANGDLARTNFSGDYSAEHDGEESVGGKPAYRLKLKSKRKGVTYSHLTYWVSQQKPHMPLQAEFYASSGKRLKKAIYSQEKKVAGRKIVTKIVITDDIKKTSRSELTYSNFKKAKLEESRFNKDALAD